MNEAARRHEELASIARDLASIAGRDASGLSGRVASLSIADQAELALRLDAKTRLELLLHAPKPMALVRALPDFEVYLTIREVGPADALPLLALASGPQIAHVLDLESWRGDRFDPERSGAWVALLLEAGEPTVRRFLNVADDELLALLFRRWIRSTPIEIDHEEPTRGHGETEAGDERGFLSPDGNHRFSPSIPEHAPAVRRFAEIFFHEQQKRYLRVIWESSVELPAELEEREHSWRQGRLEEHGFPPWDEAIEVYAPPRGGAAPLPITVEDGLAGARSLLLRQDTRGLLSRAIDSLDGPSREAAVFGISAVANRLVVAERWDTGDPAAHRLAFERAIGFVTIALEGRHATDPEAAAATLVDQPAIDLFRQGWARAVEAQRRVRALLRDGWASRHPRAIDLVEAPIRARLKGLALDRPRAWDPELPAGAEPYREFRSLAELDEARSAVDLAELLGRVLLDGLGAPVAAVEEGATFSTLLLTGAAWFAVRGELRGDAVPVDVAEAFLRNAAPSDLDAFVAALAGEEPALRLFAKASFDRLAGDRASLSQGAAVGPSTVGSLRLARG
jgi:hypothetical protein